MRSSTIMSTVFVNLYCSLFPAGDPKPAEEVTYEDYLGEYERVEEYAHFLAQNGLTSAWAEWKTELDKLRASREDFTESSLDDE